MFGLKKTTHFWKWFEENNSKYLFINEVEDHIKEQHLHEFLRELHQVNDGIYYLIGGHPDDKKVELIITAEGIKELFPVVEQLVSEAPILENWKVIAFKPPQGTDFVTEFAGKKFDPHEIYFIPLEHENEPHLIGIQVIFPDFNEKERNVFIGGVYQVIDTILGERSTTLDIDYLEVTRTPPGISEDSLLKLAELKEYISSKKYLD